MAVITSNMEDVPDVPTTIDHCYDGIIMLSSDMIFFNDARPRPDGRKIYHIFEHPDNLVGSDESFNSDIEENDTLLSLFSKASENNIQTIRKVLESNGISFDEWCPPISPLDASYSSQTPNGVFEGEVESMCDDDKMLSEAEIFKKKKSKIKVSAEKRKKHRQKFLHKLKKVKSEEDLPDVKPRKKLDMAEKNHFECSKCAFTTNIKGSLKIHQITHLGVKSLACSLCSFKTNYKNSLKVHLLAVHRMSAERCVTEVSKVKDINSILSLGKESDKTVVKEDGESLVEKKVDRDGGDSVKGGDNTMKEEINALKYLAGETVKEDKDNYGSSGDHEQSNCSKSPNREESGGDNAFVPAPLDKKEENLQKVTSEAFRIGESLKKSPKSFKMAFNHKWKAKYYKLKALRMRKREFKTVEKPILRCSECAFRTRKKVLLKRHLLKEHLNLKCSECDFSCQTNPDFEEHKLSHMEYKCSKCDYSSSSKIRLKKHEASHDEATQFSCEECDFVTTVREDFIKHEVKHKRAKHRVYNCSECTFSCGDKDEMSQHDLNHMEIRLFRCKRCSFATNYENELVEHNLKHFRCYSKGEKIYLCSRCNYKSKFKSLIKQHERTHSISQMHKCSHCNFESRNLETFRFHVLSHEQMLKATEEEVYKCSECTFTCTDQEEMSQHDLNHIEVGLFRCKFCNYSTNIEQELMEHNFKHAEGKAFTCSRCNFRSSLKASMKQHELSHFQVKLYKCAQCDYSTNYKGNLKLHERNNHSESKLYNCPLCEYSTDFKNYLDLHSVSHLEGKKLKCPICSYSTSFKTELRSHIAVIHQSKQRHKRSTTPKELQCEDCDFKTTSRTGYNQHRRTHSSIKEFKCPFCEHACNFKANLVKHIGYKHPDQVFES